MKKIFSKIIIASVLFVFILPVFFTLGIKNSDAAEEWYYTRTNNLLINLGDAIEFIKSTSVTECTTKRTADKSDPKNITLGSCTQKVQAPNEEGWGYNVDTKIAPALSNNPIAFKTEEDCNTNRNNYLKSDLHKNDTFFVSISTCTYKKGVSNNGVVNVTGKQIAAGDKYDPVYHLLAPIGTFTEIKTDDIGGYFDKIFLIAIGLCGALAVIMFVIGGIQYMGEESIWAKTKGKEQMTSAILGLLIALGSWALLNTINPDLLGGSGLLVSSANIKLDMKIHGDTPQESAVGGKYCNGRVVDGATIDTVTGRAWNSDLLSTDINPDAERAKVKAVGIKIQREGASCTHVGQKGCTSLTGLDTGPVINFKTKICPTCEVVINGATECWEHSAGTTHYPRNAIVDLDDTPTMNTYVQSGKKDSAGNGLYQYTKDGIKFLYELNHYHIVSW